MLVVSHTSTVATDIALQSGPDYKEDITELAYGCPQWMNLSDCDLSSCVMMMTWIFGRGWNVIVLANPSSVLPSPSSGQISICHIVVEHVEQVGLVDSKKIPVCDLLSVWSFGVSVSVWSFHFLPVYAWVFVCVCLGVCGDLSRVYSLLSSHLCCKWAPADPMQHHWILSS